jgi:hypothetical protein
MSDLGQLLADTNDQATQFIFLATKILVSVLATGDFISLMIQSFAFLVFFSYVPWALVCDFRTAKEVNIERERIRRIRRGEDLDHVGESTLENKGKKNRWRSDRAWQECLFLTLQGICWLGECFSGISSAGRKSNVDSLELGRGSLGDSGDSRNWKKARDISRKAGTTFIGAAELLCNSEPDFK